MDYSDMVKEGIVATLVFMILAAVLESSGNWGTVISFAIGLISIIIGIVIFLLEINHNRLSVGGIFASVFGLVLVFATLEMMVWLLIVAMVIDALLYLADQIGL